MLVVRIPHNPYKSKSVVKDATGEKILFFDVVIKGTVDRGVIKELDIHSISYKGEIVTDKGEHMCFCQVEFSERHNSGYRVRYEACSWGLRCVVP